MTVETRDRFAQGISHFFLGQRLRHCPKAEFASFQPRPEIRDECIEQVFLGLVKHEEVSAPRHIAHHANPGLSQLRINGLRCHGHHLSYEALLGLIGKVNWNRAPWEADTRDNCPP